MTSSSVALVTGANKGIGLEVARGLLTAGCTVLVGARDSEAGRRAAGDLGREARAIELDVLRPATVAAAADRVGAEFGRLDILVNNAGIVASGDGPPGQADLAAVRSVLETNFLGTAAVAQAMLPHLRAAPAARIVNVSSGLGSLVHNADPDWEFASVKPLGYCASKAALNMLTVQLAWELRSTAIKVNAADPGYTASDLNGHRGTQTVEQGAEVVIRLALLNGDGPTGGFFHRDGTHPW